MLTSIFLRVLPGCENPDLTSPGVFAPDAEAYATFGPVLEHAVKVTHGLPEKKQVHQPALDLGDPEKLKLDDLDPEGKYVVKTQVKVTRNVEGFAFNPLLTKEVSEGVQGMHWSLGTLGVTSLQ